MLLGRPRFEGEEIRQQAVEFHRLIEHGEVPRFFQGELLGHRGIGCLFGGNGDGRVAFAIHEQGGNVQGAE